MNAQINVVRNRIVKLEAAWLGMDELIGELKRELQVIEQREIGMLPERGGYAPVPIPSETAAYEDGL